jgi:hypothetical protein
MGVVGWVAIAAAFLLLVGALRLGAQVQARAPAPVAPRAVPPVPTRTPARAAAFWDEARVATRDALNAWVLGAEARGKIKGSAAVLEGDWLVNPRVDLAAAIQAGLKKSGAPEDLGVVLAHEVADGWKAWIRGYKTTHASAFPAFAAWPAGQAPETKSPAPGLSLRHGVSSADAAVGRDLAARLKARLPNESPAAIDAFASWLEGRVTTWVRSASLADLSGKGPVPSFAPPYVPVGPVVGSLTARVVSPAGF